MYNETYDEYIRSILGYPSLNSYENNIQDYRNQNMNINYNTGFDMNGISENDLENCYPEIYKIIYPMVTTRCNNIGANITKEDIENITDEIYNALDGIDNTQKTSTTNSNNTRIAGKKTEPKTNETTDENRETRQYNRNLRDLIQILLIRELLRRRRPGRPPISPPPPPPMHRPGPRPPMRPPFRPGDTQFNRQFEMLNNDIYEY